MTDEELSKKISDQIEYIESFGYSKFSQMKYMVCFELILFVLKEIAIRLPESKSTANPSDSPVKYQNSYTDK